MNIREQIATLFNVHCVGVRWNLIEDILALVDKHYNEKPSGLVAIDKDGNKRDIPIAEALECMGDEYKGLIERANLNEKALEYLCNLVGEDVTITSEYVDLADYCRKLAAESKEGK